MSDQDVVIDDVIQPQLCGVTVLAVEDHCVGPGLGAGGPENVFQQDAVPLLAGL
jgi:hypothetical protein